MLFFFPSPVKQTPRQEINCYIAQSRNWGGVNRKTGKKKTKKKKQRCSHAGATVIRDVPTRTQNKMVRDRFKNCKCFPNINPNVYTMQMKFWPNILKRLQVLWENPISTPAAISTSFERYLREISAPNRVRRTVRLAS